VSLSGKDSKFIDLLAKTVRDIELFTKVLYGWEKLSPKQVDLLKMDGEINAILAGRRFGKSSLLAAKTFHFALTHPETNALVTAPSLDQARIYFDMITGSLEEHPFSILVRSVKLNPFPEIALVNGSSINFRSTAFKGKYLRGRKTHYIVATEAAFIDDNVFESVIMPMRLDTKAKIYLESTPFGKNYFYRLYQLGMRGDGLIKAFHATVYDNLVLDRDEIERQKQSTPQYIWRTEYLAEFLEDEDYVFSFDMVNACMEDYVPAGYIKGHKFVIGLDIAQKEDYTVFTVLDITNKVYTIADFRRFNKKSYDEIILLANELSDIYNAPVYVDATAVGRPIAEKIRRAVPITFSARTKKDLIDNLILMFEQKKIRIPSSNTILRDELRYFRFEGSHDHAVPRVEEYAVHDDAVISLALACWGAQQSYVGSTFIDIWG